MFERIKEFFNERRAPMIIHSSVFVVELAAIYGVLHLNSLQLIDAPVGLLVGLLIHNKIAAVIMQFTIKK